MTDNHEKITDHGGVAWMAGHPVAANLLMLLCIVGGLFWAQNIKQEVFPEFSIDMVVVNVSYPGSSPAEVERGILLSIEDAVSGLEGVDQIRSEAKEGVGTVLIEALTGADVQKLAQDVKTEVDRISTFPEDAEKPKVRVADNKREVIKLAIFGDTSNGTLHSLAEQFRDILLQDPGITQVSIFGLPPLEIAISVSQASLRRYNLTLAGIAAHLQRSSVELPGGGIKAAGGEILVRVTDRRDYGREFARMPVVTTASGGQVLLGDIATITDGFAETDQLSLYNGKPAVIISIYRVGEQTPIEISDRAQGYMETFTAALPAGVSMASLSDRSDSYRQRIDLLLRNAAMGLILVFCMLSLFLEIKLAFWVMMGIPISFLGSFLILPHLGISLNMVSLFAYIIALGIVVDDAIVVGENIYHYRQEGLPTLTAAIQGAQDMVVPVTFSILTNIVTFLPLALVPGIMGKIFRVIPVVVITVFIISLFESLFLLPAHLGHSGKNKRTKLGDWLHHEQQIFSHAFRDWVKDKYGAFLALVLRYHYLTIVSFLAVLIVTMAYALSGRMGFGLFPKIESDFARVTMVLPYGIPVEKTKQITQHIAESARKVAASIGAPELIVGVFDEIGTGGSHNSRVYVFLAPSAVRDKIMSTSDFTEKWREEVGPVVGVETITFEADAGGPGSGRAITVELNHRDMEVLEAASAELAAVLATYPLVKDVDDGFRPGKEQLDFSILPEGESLGVSSSQIARQVRGSFYGVEAMRQQRGRNELKVVLRLPEAERSSMQSLEDLLITTPSGGRVPLNSIATVTHGRSYTSINRRRGRRVAQVEADITPRSKADEVLGDIKAEVLPQLVAKYPGLRYSFEGKRAEMIKSMGSLKTTFLLAMLVVYALLAIPFRSYLQPLIVMASIPYGIIGAFWGHIVMGYSLSILSMFGVVALAGVVVNDSLIMVDTANSVRRKNPDLSSYEVITRAAIQRFRPIVLTTLTTFGGLLPMIFETSKQARFLIPMAISLGFGILFATFITLVLVPALYLMVEDLQSFG